MNTERPNLNIIEGEIKTSVSFLSTFQGILDRTYNYLVASKTNEFTSLPMWLFEYYSMLSDLRDNKELYAPEKYERCATMKTEFYQLMLTHLGVEEARNIFGLKVETNIIENDLPFNQYTSYLRIA